MSELMNSQSVEMSSFFLAQRYLFYSGGVCSRKVYLFARRFHLFPSFFPQSAMEGVEDLTFDARHKGGDVDCHDMISTSGVEELTLIAIRRLLAPNDPGKVTSTDAGGSRHLESMTSFVTESEPRHKSDPWSSIDPIKVRSIGNFDSGNTVSKYQRKL
ncbi:unnamed protein product [Notodromas monacha]|uniref:Uncharacterized protein n=1 Tax=Notodromas monacha TaxID=399045 RepID=A0A7R9BNF3_9CRUS|nr:unnamed protein product [Notodromas monacha]CAG0917355.1 unnamed protein product [Notodromas monacha]